MSVLVRARRAPKVGALRAIYNPRARLCGPILLLGALECAGQFSRNLDLGGAIVWGTFAVLLIALGCRMSVGFTMSIRPPVLRLHNGLWTRTLRLSDIAQCRPCVTSKGLIYLAAIPEFVLADGSSVLLNGV